MEEHEIRRPAFKVFPFRSHVWPVMILSFLSLLFYFRTLDNEYALDDGIVIQQNEYVLKGARGIGSFLTKDLFHSFYTRMNARDQLDGGRYRPLPVITYALEQELIGPYRTGDFNASQDLNDNGYLDQAPVMVSNSRGEQVKRFEFNEFIDMNGDLQPQPAECPNCWDHNKNFSNDKQEDLNKDGVFNEVDCHVDGAALRHLTNILLFLACCLCLYLFLARHLLEGRPDLAFLATLVFAIHPVHSEVVANVKGREDLLSVLFITLFLHYAFVYMKHGRWQSLLASAGGFFLALMSKEHAAAGLVLLPLSFYVSGLKNPSWRVMIPALCLFLILAATMVLADIQLHFFNLPPLVLYASLAFLFFLVLLSPSLRRGAALQMVVTLQVFLLYLALRLNAVVVVAAVPDTEILNNPWLFASGAQQVATKTFILLKYLALVFYPHPLVSDYSFSSIELRTFSSVGFLASLCIHLFLLAAGILLLRKKHIAGFGILTYLLFVFMVSNLLFNTHLVMLESFLFHANLGSALVLAWLLLKGAEIASAGSVSRSRVLLFPVILLLVVFACIKAWERSADWKNDVTLFLRDVKHAPNSVLVLGNAGARWVDLADTKEITGMLLPGQDPNTWNDYNGQLVIDDEDWKAQGHGSRREAALYKGIVYLRRATSLHPRYVNGYLNLGLAYYKLGQDDSTTFYWKVAEYLYPHNPYLENYYSVYTGDLHVIASRALNESNFHDAIKAYKRLLVLRPDDLDAMLGLAGTYVKFGNPGFAKNHLEKVLQMDPGNKKAVEMLELVNAPAQ